MLENTVFPSIGHLFDHRRVQIFDLSKFFKSLCIRKREYIIASIVFEILELVRRADRMLPQGAHRSGSNAD